MSGISVDPLLPVAPTTGDDPATKLFSFDYFFDRLLRRLDELFREQAAAITDLYGLVGTGSGGGGSYTAGSVIFAGASGGLTEDNPNFFFDNTNDRLGIGTNAPTAKIHVKASTTFAGIRAEYTGTGTGWTNADMSYQVVNSGTIVGEFAGTPSTTTPAGPALANMTYMQGLLAGGVAIFAYDPTATIRMCVGGNSSNVYERVRVGLSDSGGSGPTIVGDEIMHLTGNNASGMRQLRIENTAASSGGAGGVGVALMIAGATLGRFHHYGTGGTGTGPFAPGSTILYGSGVQTTIAATDAAGILGLYTGGSVAANERMRVDAAGKVGVGNNLGALSATPSGYNFVVSNTSIPNYIVSEGKLNTAYGGLLIRNDAGDGGTYATTGSAFVTSGMFQANNTYLVNYSANDLWIANSKAGKAIRFVTNGSAASDEKMQIDSAGKVGIGTTPSQVLHVKTATGAATEILDAVDTTQNAGISLRSNNTSELNITGTGTGWSPTFTLGAAAQGVFDALGAGGALIMASNASGVVKIAAGGNATANEIARIDASGIKIQQAGNTLSIKEGTNACQGLATLVAGTVTVNTNRVTAVSRIHLTAQNTGGTPGAVRVASRVVGTSFTITSTSGADTSSVAWTIFEPS